MKNTPKPTRHTFTAILALLTLAIPAFGDEPVTNADLPEDISLNGDWQFFLAKSGEEVDQQRGFYRDDFDRSAYDSIPVPSNWNMLGYEDPHWVNGTDSVGFYVRKFKIPEGTDDMRILLHFGGVWVSAEVWVNGENHGRHDSGFTKFAVDISDALKPGEENVLAVKVVQQLPHNLFKFDANDDWGLAGIYRDVWLEFTPSHLYLSNVEVETDLDDEFKHAQLNLRAFVVRSESGTYFEPSPPFEINTTLKSTDGEVVKEQTDVITVTGPSNGRDFRISMDVRNPRKWTAETPNLYDLEVEIVRDGVVVHDWQDRIGFREISTEGGILRVNGEVVKLRGVARHDLAPEVGRATREEHWREDIELMKAGNINAVRTAHYPPAEGFVRLCDELGMYVVDEIPLGFGGDRMRRPEFAEGMLLRIHETIKRDRNRPSVIVWSFGNEDPVTYLHLVGLRAIKGIDDTRPILLPFRFEEDLPPEVGILAPHYWKTRDYDRLGATARRPVITTETSHALGSRDFGEFEQRWEALTSHPAGAGTMIWLWADQGLKRPTEGRDVHHPMKDKDKYTREGGELVRDKDAGEGYIYDSHGNYGSDGIVDADLEPQRDYWEAKAVYAQVEILEDRVPFKPGQESVTLMVLNEFDFTDLSEVTFEWKLMDLHRVLDHGELSIEGGPHLTVPMDVPTTAISAEDGAGVYYLDIAILRPDGSELARESVRLGYGKPDQPEGPVADASWSVKENGDSVTVRAGDLTYAFNPKSGEIAEIRNGKQVLAGNSELIVWRPATHSERNRYDRRDNQHDWDTYMQGLEGKALDWSVEQDSDTVTIVAKSEYEKDDLNRVVAHYKYTVRQDGTLEVDLTIEPEMDIPELPEIGIALQAGDAMDRLIWLGQGPISSRPGKTAATRFGWWAAGPESQHAEGTKYGLEWAKLDYNSGSQLHVYGNEGIRLENTDDGPKLRILTHVGGSWTKNGPPENPNWHLDLESNDSFTGRFKIVPTKR